MKFAQRAMVPTVSSIEELNDVFATVVPNKVRRVRSDDLTAEEFKELNAHVVENTFAFFVKCTEEMIDALADIRQCVEGEQPLFTVAGKGYVLGRNVGNRWLTARRIGPPTTTGTYSNDIVRGRWATLAGVLMYSDEATIISAQHTISALKTAIASGHDISDLSVLCIVGLPRQYANLSDKGRSRDKIQDNYGDASLFPETIFEEIQLERTAPEARQKERIAMLKLHSSIASTVCKRFNGKDFSTTGDKMPWGDESAFCHRLPNFDDLQRLCVKLESAGHDASGERRYWYPGRGGAGLFSPAIVGSALILASNDEGTLSEIVSESLEKETGETVEAYAERRLAKLASLYDSSSSIQLDWNLVERVLELLEQSTDNAGPLSKVFADLTERKSTNKKDASKKKWLYEANSIAAMSAFVQLVKNIQTGDLESSVWTNYRVVDGKVAPAYRCFGGLDIGYTKESKN